MALLNPAMFSQGSPGLLGPYVGQSGGFPVTPQEQQARLGMILSGLLGGMPAQSATPPASPFDNAVPYSPQNMPATIGDTLPKSPPVAPQLAPPVNVPSMPVAEAQPDSIPQAAKPTQYAPQPQSAAQPQPTQLPSFLGGGSGLLDGLKNHLASGLSIISPQAGQAYMQQQIMRAALPQLLQQTGGDLPKAMALLQNQKLQEQIYGNPTSLGEVKTGDVSFPAYAQGGKVGYAMPGGQSGMGGLVQMGANAKRISAAAEAEGKAQGTNAAALPEALARADTAIALIDDIKKDPALPNAIGAIAGRLPAIGGEQANIVSKIDQLKGQSFMQAWQALKGAGARITNMESARATDAIGRLQRTQTVEGFQKALDDLRSVIVGVRTRSGTLAGGEPTPPPQAAQAPSYSQDQLRAEAIRRGLIKQ